MLKVVKIKMYDVRESDQLLFVKRPNKKYVALGMIAKKLILK